MIDKKQENYAYREIDSDQPIDKQKEITDKLENFLQELKAEAGILLIRLPSDKADTHRTVAFVDGKGWQLMEIVCEAMEKSTFIEELFNKAVTIFNKVKNK